MDAVRSFRPPNARSTIYAEGPDARHVTVTLAGGMTPQSAVEQLVRLVDFPDEQPGIIVPANSNRPQSGVHPHIAASFLGGMPAGMSLGLRGSASVAVRRRWEQLARRQGSDAVILGTRGWNRILFPQEGYRLDSAYMPVELLDVQTRVALLALDDNNLALGFWRELAHPHTRLRSRNADRVRMDAELSTMFHASYMLDASRMSAMLSFYLLAWTDHPVAAELVGHGLQRYVEDERGYESRGPWEQPPVQAAAEIGHGPVSGSSILIRADPVHAGVRAMCVYLADQLGCGVEWLTGRNQDD